MNGILGSPYFLTVNQMKSSQLLVIMTRFLQLVYVVTPSLLIQVYQMRKTKIGNYTTEIRRGWPNKFKGKSSYTTGHRANNGNTAKHFNIPDWDSSCLGAQPFKCRFNIVVQMVVYCLLSTKMLCIVFFHASFSIVVLYFTTQPRKLHKSDWCVAGGD